MTQLLLLPHFAEEKLRLRENEQLAQGDTADNWEGWDLRPGISSPRPSATRGLQKHRGLKGEGGVQYSFVKHLLCAKACARPFRSYSDPYNH